MRPYDARSEKDCCYRLANSSVDTPSYWMLTDGYRVSLAEQKNGEAPKQHICFKRATFNRFIDWYMKNQPVPKRKSVRKRKGK